MQVLLVPTTEVLLTSRDKDSGTSYADLSGSEEFLASHVLRVPGGVGPNNQIRDASSFRETRGKAKQFTTANGRTVIVKDAFIYSNKGARAPRQVSKLQADTAQASRRSTRRSFSAMPSSTRTPSRPSHGSSTTSRAP